MLPHMVASHRAAAACSGTPQGTSHPTARPMAPCALAIGGLAYVALSCCLGRLVRVLTVAKTRPRSLSNRAWSGAEPALQYRVAKERGTWRGEAGPPRMAGRLKW